MLWQQFSGCATRYHYSLNRFAEMKGLEPIFGGDVSNRYEVADFCCETVKEYFDNRTL